MNQVQSETKLIGSVPRGAGEEVQVQIREYKGKKFLDIRLWYMAKTENVFLPTKKGVFLPLNQIEGLKDILSQINVEEEQTV